MYSSPFEKRQLLCTFSNKKDYEALIPKIKKFYSMNNKIFVFTNEKNDKEIFLSYNVSGIEKTSPKYPNTILIHRKKQTNTLYSLNALNRLIEEENGTPDNTFMLSWELYENCLIITGEISVRIIPLKMVAVI